MQRQPKDYHRWAATLFLSLCLCASIIGVNASPTFPYQAVVNSGDFAAAQFAFGMEAQNTVKGHDAIPVFLTVAAYDEYYRLADDTGCDLNCVRPTYDRLKGSGSLELLPVGAKLTVVKWLDDPKDTKYKICEVHIDRRRVLETRYVVCVALHPNYGV